MPHSILQRVSRMLTSRGEVSCGASSTGGSACDHVMTRAGHIVSPTSAALRRCKHQILSWCCSLNVVRQFGNSQLLNKDHFSTPHLHGDFTSNITLNFLSWPSVRNSEVNMASLMSEVSQSSDAGNLSPNRETLKRVVCTDVNIAMWNMCTDLG
jgi:hypothetical protein